ncbi:MAG: L,D-transpeptidase family protein [Chthoniobacterales bacterium]
MKSVAVKFVVISALVGLTSVLLHADTALLRAGEFTWNPEFSTRGPLVIIISLREQPLSAYRNGIRIARSSISSGRKGRSTPAGVFTILEKEVTHYSNKYDHAPMPYMQRLTWQGIALHGGDLPGYPASHGCIRLPKTFARLLYSITTRGTTVMVMRESAGADPDRPPRNDLVAAGGRRITADQGRL